MHVRSNFVLSDEILHKRTLKQVGSKAGLYTTMTTHAETEKINKEASLLLQMALQNVVLIIRLFVLSGHEVTMV